MGFFKIIHNVWRTIYLSIILKMNLSFSKYFCEVKTICFEVWVMKSKKSFQKHDVKFSHVLIGKKIFGILSISSNKSQIYLIFEWFSWLALIT